jgi:Flp pilus assembly pilin Flp
MEFKFDFKAPSLKPPLKFDSCALCPKPLSRWEPPKRVPKKYLAHRSSIMRKFRGQALIEYGLLLVLVVAIVVAALAVFGSTLTDLFSSINSKIADALA